jgi:hypothetical protein
MGQRQGLEKVWMAAVVGDSGNKGPLSNIIKSRLLVELFAGYVEGRAETGEKGVISPD